VKDVAAALITDKGWDTVYPARSVKAQQWPTRVTTMASFDDQADWDEANERRSAAKWKQPSSPPYDGLTPKKRKTRLQPKVCPPTSLRPKLHSLGQGSRVATVSNPDSRLPSLASSAPEVMGTETRFDRRNLGGSFRHRRCLGLPSARPPHIAAPLQW